MIVTHHGVEIRLLGPVRAVVDGKDIPLRRRQERCLLAILALEPGQYVSIGHVADFMWANEPPACDRAAIHTMVSHLRSALRPAEPHGVRVLTRGVGYALEAGAESIDLHRFRSFVDRGRAATTNRERVVLLGAALGSWHGPALADAATETWQQARLCAQLEELRLEAYEEWLDARLELGEHRQVVAQLTRLVHDHPLRERPPGQLMLALYRCGRRAEALAVYRRTRDTLVAELGLEPRAQLKRLQRAILTDDWALADAAGFGSSTSVLLRA